MDGPTAVLRYASIISGQKNIVEGLASAVAGGARNTASGAYGTVAGGDANVVRAKCQCLSFYTSA